jgi:hypothetical protein
MSTPSREEARIRSRREGRLDGMAMVVEKEEEEDEARSHALFTEEKGRETLMTEHVYCAVCSAGFTLLLHHQGLNIF